MMPADQLRSLATQFGYTGSDLEAAAAFIRRELTTCNLFKVDVAAANAVLAAWEQAPETIAARAAAAALEAEALAEANTAAATWARIAEGLDEETLLELAQRTAKPLGKGALGAVTLDHTTGTAQVEATAKHPAMTFWWNGDAFELLPERFGPPPSILLTLEELRALAAVNTPEATWARIAESRSEADVLRLATQTAQSLCDGAEVGAVTLDHTTGTARVAATAKYQAFTLRWDGAAFGLYPDNCPPPLSVLLTVEALRVLATDTEL